MTSLGTCRCKPNQPNLMKQSIVKIGQRSLRLNIIKFNEQLPHYHFTMTQTVHWNFFKVKFKPNSSLYSLHVTSWRDRIRVIAPGQLSSFPRNIAAVANRCKATSDFTGTSYEPQTFGYRDQHITAKSIWFDYCITQLKYHIQKIFKNCARIDKQHHVNC